MAVSGLRVRVRKGDLTLLDQVDSFTSLTGIPVHNNVGSWTLTIDADDDKADLFTAGRGLVVWRDGVTDPIFSGPITGLRVELPDGGRQEILTVTGATDELVLTGRVCYPDPTVASTAQSTAYADVQTGNAETVIRHYVDLNAAAGALSARRLAGLALAANGNHGPTVTKSARYDRLLDLIGPLADQAGLGFRVVYLPATAALEFRVFAPVDRSATVRFARELDNLTGYSYQLLAPTVTRAIVGGGGVGTARVTRERANTTAETDWGIRAEEFIDQRDTSTTATLDQSGDEALTAGEPTAGLLLTVTDTEQLQYGRDYGLGDTVTAIVRGIPVVDVLTQVRLDVDAQAGLKVKPVVGSQNPADGGKALYKRLAALRRRILGIEGRQ
jgi:hypothetical protein